jgi:hypothetical protein
MVKWKTRWEGIDSQEVGLEAAILQRKRNSSLIESSCAEDVTGLKPCTEAADIRKDMVGERSVGLRRWGVNPAGDIRSANADMSSDKACEKHARRKPKVSCATFIGAG